MVNTQPPMIEEQMSPASTKYHKIQNVFKRNPDDKSRVLVGQWTMPEFEYLRDCTWVFTEKVDGANIRIMFDDDGGVTFGGKTDRALIPATLVSRLNEHVAGWGGPEHMNHAGLVLYGEGYGPKIQKRGASYRDDQDFVLFDVRAGHWWLKREDVEGIGKALGLDVVPIVGAGPLSNAISCARSGGWGSAWGDFPAEGVIARPAVELKARSGERIICKIKTRDFRPEEQK